MERLRPWRQTEEDDTSGNRVPATLLSPRTTQRLRPDPAFRISIQSTPRIPTASLPTVAGDGYAPTIRTVKWRLQSIYVALPTLRRGHGCNPKAHSRGSLAVQLLRFLITPPRVAVPRRAASAPANSCVQSHPNLPVTSLAARFSPRTPAILARLESHIRAAGNSQQRNPEDQPYQSGLQSP